MLHMTSGCGFAGTIAVCCTVATMELGAFLRIWLGRPEPQVRVERQEQQERRVARVRLAQLEQLDP